MNAYKQGDNYQGLEPINYLELVGAKVLDGHPQCALRVDAGSVGGALAAGVFDCTRGKFELFYGVNEFATLLEGKLTVTRPDGSAVDLRPGDSFFTAKGETLIWDVKEDMRKCFFLVPNT